jgi:hypothetical protein
MYGLGRFPPENTHCATIAASPSPAATQYNEPMLLLQFMMHICNSRKLINNKSKLAATVVTIYAPFNFAKRALILPLGNKKRPPNWREYRTRQDCGALPSEPSNHTHRMRQLGRGVFQGFCTPERENRPRRLPRCVRCPRDPAYSVGGFDRRAGRHGRGLAGRLICIGHDPGGRGYQRPLSWCL